MDEWSVSRRKIKKYLMKLLSGPNRDQDLEKSEAMMNLSEPAEAFDLREPLLKVQRGSEECKMQLSTRDK